MIQLTYTSIDDRLLLLVAHLDYVAVVCADLHGLDVYVCPCHAVTQRHSLGSPHTMVALQRANEHQVQEENAASHTACGSHGR